MKKRRAGRQRTRGPMPLTKGRTMVGSGACPPGYKWPRTLLSKTFREPRPYRVLRGCSLASTGYFSFPRESGPSVSKLLKLKLKIDCFVLYKQFHQLSSNTVFVTNQVLKSVQVRGLTKWYDLSEDRRQLSSTNNADRTATTTPPSPRTPRPNNWT